MAQKGETTSWPGESGGSRVWIAVPVREITFDEVRVFYRAYYVTFIFPGDQSRKFFGGFIEPRKIRAFPENCESLPIGGAMDNEELRRSVPLATDTTSLSLASDH